MSKPFRFLTGALMACAVATTATLVGSATASAGPAEQDADFAYYADSTRLFGKAFDDLSSAQALARNVCTDLNAGGPTSLPMVFRDAIQTAQFESAEMAQKFIRVAIRSYCPDQSDVVPADWPRING